LLLVYLDEGRLGLTAVEVINALAEGRPPVCLAQGWVDGGAVAVNPTQLAADEVSIVLERLLAVLGS
jgi:hypothetical protein